MKIPDTELSYVYIYVYARLRERIHLKEYVSPKRILDVIKQVCRVPKVLHYPILKQLEKAKLIKRINHQKYQVLEQNYIKIIKNLGYDNFWR